MLAPLARPIEEIRRPLVFFTDGIGDLLMFVPTVRALARIFEGRLELMGREGVAPVVYAGLGIRRFHEDVLRGRDGDEPLDPKLISPELAQSDCMICLNDWDSGAVDSLIQQVAPRESIGFDPSFGTVLERRFEVHNAEFAFEVVKCLAPGSELQDFWGPIPPTERAASAVASLRAELLDGALLVAVHAETGGSKNLTAEAWSYVVDGLLALDPRLQLVLLGLRESSLGPGSADPSRVHSALGQPIDVSIAIAAGADLFVGIDSSMLHAADLGGTPGVGVFTVTDATRWGVWSPGSEPVECPARGMGDGEVGRILVALRRVAREQLGVALGIDVHRGVGSAARPSAAGVVESLGERTLASGSLRGLRGARRPAVLFGYGIGDHLIHLPALRALAELFPGALQVKCRPGLEELFFGDVEVGRFFEDDFSEEGLDRIPVEKPLPAALREADLILSLNNWSTPGFEQLMGRLRHIPCVGFDEGCSTRLPYDSGKHTAQLSFDLVRAIEPSLQLETFARPPLLSVSALEFADGLRAGLRPGDQLVAVHPFCRSSVRSLPSAAVEGWLTESVETDPRLHFALLGPEAAGLRHLDASDRIHLCDRLPLADSIAIIAAADLYVGIDSSLLHAADLLRTPALAIFGLSSAAQWGTCLTPTIEVTLGQDLSTCDRGQLESKLRTGFDALRQRSSGQQPSHPHRTGLE
ncbi:MAG: glycosyltransferase family 9 protein [Planctomycetota bacterium]